MPLRQIGRDIMPLLGGSIGSGCGYGDEQRCALMTLSHLEGLCEYEVYFAWGG